jgi:hypothetical protein
MPGRMPGGGIIPPIPGGGMYPGGGMPRPIIGGGIPGPPALAVAP